jgi:hypothetical protein
MTDGQPVEPDAIIGRDGATVPYKRADRRSDLLLPHPHVPTSVRLATVGPVLTASAFALTAVAAARVVKTAGRMAWRLAGGDAEVRVVPGQHEVAWTRVEIRWKS